MRRDDTNDVPLDQLYEEKPNTLNLILKKTGKKMNKSLTGKVRKNLSSSPQQLKDEIITKVDENRALEVKRMKKGKQG